MFQVEQGIYRYCLNLWSNVFHTTESSIAFRVRTWWKSKWYSRTESQVYISHIIIRCLAYLPRAYWNCCLQSEDAKNIRICIYIWKAWRWKIIPSSSTVVQYSSLASISRLFALIFKLWTAFFVRLTPLLSFMMFFSLNKFFFMFQMYWISTDRYLQIRRTTWDFSLSYS